MQKAKSKKISKCFRAKLIQLDQMLDFVQGVVSQKMILAVEEALVNVITHGYPDNQGNIEISLHQQNSETFVTIRDEGIPFNPTQLKYTFSPEQVGGVGVHLCKGMVKKMDYQRIGKRNVLILTML